VCAYTAGDISALEEQGLSPELLDRMLSGQDMWQLTSTPPRQFYIQLHSHLKQKGNLSKGEIGALYTKLDPHFESYRSDNAYRVIDKMCKAKTLDRSAAMTYYNERSPKYNTQVQGSSKQAFQQLEEELNQPDLQTYGVEQQNGSDTDFVVTTTSGKRYSNAVRELYCRLLSKQIPPAKIPEIIIAVLKVMVPPS